MTRWADTSDADRRVQRLLAHSSQEPSRDKRSAHFVVPSVLAALRGERFAEAEEPAKASSTETPYGIWLPAMILFSPTFDRTMAEISAEQKNQISPTAKAHRALLSRHSTFYHFIFSHLPLTERRLLASRRYIICSVSAVRLEQGLYQTHVCIA